MRARTWSSSIAVGVSVLMVVSEVSATAAPAVTAASEPKIVVPPPTELDKPWSPAKGAIGQRSPKSSAPTTEWRLPESRGKSEVALVAKAPVGTVAGAPGLGALPYFSFDEVPLSTDTVARVNLGNGNLLLTSADGALHGPALSVRNDRFYNGLSTADGSLGAGWSSPLSSFDVGLDVTSSSSATFLGPNGFTATFTKPGSAWVAPAGFNATLVDGSSTKTLTYNRTGEQLVFNSSGWLIQDLDRNGVGTTYAYVYGPSGRIDTITEAAGRSYSVAWTTGPALNPLITSVTDSAGRTTTYTHDTAGQLIRVDSPGSYWEEYDYDSSGRISQMRAVGTGGSATTTRIDFSYDAQSRVTGIDRGPVAGPALATQTYAYASRQTTVTDGRGKDSVYTIDSEGRVESATDALGRVRSQTWTANSDVATTTDATGSGGTPGQTTTYAYDALNNAIGTTLPTGAAASAGYATGVGCPGTGGSVYQAKCASDAAGNDTRFDYDADVNLTTVTDSTSGGTGAVSQQYTYATSGAGCAGGTGFDGQVCTSEDGNGNVTAYEYDSAGNLTVTDPPSPMGSTTYTHDTLGRILTVTDGNGDTTTYAYNVRDEIVSTTFDGGPTMTTTWYNNGITSGDNEATGIIGPLKYNYYDVLSRLTQQVTKASGHTVLYDFSYDAAGNTLSYADSDYGTTSYVYDDAGQLVQMIQPGGICPAGTGSPAGSKCIKFGYDGNGAEATRTLPGNATITTVRDASTRPTRITAKNSAGTTVADIGYSYTVPGGSGPSSDRTAIQTRTSHAATGIPAGAITTYAYDSLNRLASAVEKSGASTSASWTYDYDDAGNRTRQVRAGNTGSTAGTITYGYNAANQLTSSSADTTNWAYDAAGNQTVNGITGQTATYNPRGAVASIDSVTYTAFGQGNTETLTRSSSSTSYRTSPTGLAAEKLGSTQRVFNRTPAGEAVGMNHTFYFVTDHQKSVVGVFDHNGTWYGGYSYSPYGEHRFTGANPILDTINLRYISGYSDNSAGLQRLGARYYDASLGRFTQMDPSGQEAHPYAYAGCNPINASDPTGLSCESAVWNYVGSTLVAVGTAATGIITAPTGLGAVVFGTILVGEIAVVIGTRMDVQELCF